MKKLLLFVFAFMLVGAGCLSGEESTATSTPEPMPATDTTTITPTSGGIVTGVEVGDIDEEPVPDEEPAPEPLPILRINLDSGNFYFKPDTINAKAGQTVEITFTNNGFHTFVIDELNIVKKIEPGGKVTFTAPAAGSYKFYCNIGSHEQMGMKGTLIVK